jgi:hypothetical protein
MGTIDTILASVLEALEDPRFGEPGQWRSVPLQLLVGDVTDDPDPVASGELIDLVATSDGLVGDLAGWIERYSAYPRMPGFEPVRTYPKDHMAFRRAVRNLIKRLIAGDVRLAGPAANSEFVLPPGGNVIPELREAASRDGRRHWIGAIRLFHRTAGGPQPSKMLAWVEVVEDDDETVEARLINVVESPPGPTHVTLPDAD